MPYAPTHKPQTHERILASAAELFAQNGFEKVSIDQLMQHAGLTRGAFYSHFSDKSDVYAQAIQYSAKTRFQRYRQALQHDASIVGLINNYISLEHLDEKIPCALAFLVTDISQRDEKVRETYTKVYKNLLTALATCCTDDERSRAVCLTASALMIGSVAIARALDDETVIAELLAASRQFTQQLLE